MRVDSYTQIRQATQVLIHTHISYRLFVEGSAPPPFSTQNFILQLCVLRTLFALVPGTLFRDIGCRESQHELMIWRLAKKSTFSVSCREWFRNISTWRWLTGKVRWCAEEQGCHPAVRNALLLAAAMLEAEEELPRRLQQVALLPRVRQQPEPRQDAAGGPYLTLSLVGHGKGHLLHKIRKFR